jgi:hypothetical protein
MSTPISYWINVVSREHVMRGVEEGITQACHGKKGALSRMKQGDWVIHYSPKISLESKEKWQKFTSIGQIADDRIYEYDMGGGFVPFRRKVIYIKDIREASIVPLLEFLSFTKGVKNWGAKFRFGLFKIEEADFKMIKNQMEKNSLE